MDPADKIRPFHEDFRIALPFPPPIGKLTYLEIGDGAQLLEFRIQKVVLLFLVVERPRNGNNGGNTKKNHHEMPGKGTGYGLRFHVSHLVGTFFEGKHPWEKHGIFEPIA